MLHVLQNYLFFFSAHNFIGFCFNVILARSMVFFFFVPDSTGLIDLPNGITKMDIGFARSEKGKAVFLDRDGVINRKLPENQYVRNHEEFEILPGVRTAMSILSQLGYLLVIVTNQRGIARGLMDETELAKVHEYMKRRLLERGVLLDGVYYCPHDKDEGCRCRKPRPGMILDASRHLGIDLDQSFMVGDSDSDMLAAKNAGVRGVRISLATDDDAYMTFPSLLEFARYLLVIEGHSGKLDLGENNEHSRE